MLITDQVAIAPCTDPIQERPRTFEASKPPSVSGEQQNEEKNKSGRVACPRSW